MKDGGCELARWDRAAVKAVGPVGGARPMPVRTTMGDRVRSRRRGSADVDESALGHGAEVSNLLAPGDGERDGLSQFFE